ncbi:MAG: TetR/AcrR family transcriptional regulator [Myxococcota bacterium]
MSTERAEPAPLGRRAQTKRANRTAILDAGRRVFAGVGYDAATVRDLVRESGLSPGTFYNYFPDKQAVFRELVDEILRELRPRLVRARAESIDAAGFVRDAFAAAVATLLGDPDRFALLQRSTSAFRSCVFDGEQLTLLADELRTDLESASDAGTLPSFPAELMTAAMIGTTIEVGALGSQMGRTPDEIATFLGTLFLSGMAGFVTP